MLVSWPSTTLPLCLREVSSLGLSFPCRPGQTGQQVRAVWVILGSGPLSSERLEALSLPAGVWVALSRLALILCLSSSSDEDNKPLQGSQTSLDGTIKQQESDDSLVDYGEGGEGQFNEDGSFIGQYTVKKDKEETEGNESSEATSPVNAIYSLA